MLTIFKNNINLFRCPVCRGEIILDNNKVICESQNHVFDIENNIPLMFTGENNKGNELTEKIKDFYEINPFPNYNETDNTVKLISRAEKSGFAKMLNDELSFDIKILEAGCGTGQLTNYLSIAYRNVFGTDISFNSLKLANDFKEKNHLIRSSFYQMNLFKPIFKQNTFNVVICNGVLHHTHDPFGGFKSLLSLLNKDGYIIIGLYNKYGRIFTHLRRRLFKISGERFYNFDPYMKRADIDNLKKSVWFADQYQNPHESSHTIDEVLSWFKNTGVEFISSIPSISVLNSFRIGEHIFDKTDSGTLISRVIAQLTLPIAGYREGGFFVMIGRKKQEQTSCNDLNTPFIRVPDKFVHLKLQTHI